MGKLTSYTGSVAVISGLKAKSGDFPLMEAHSIMVDEDGTRLDAKLEELEQATGTAGVGIEEITYTASPESGGTNVITVELTDKTEKTFEILNGIQGAPGKKGADGITPDFKIEGGKLKVSYDNKSTWSEVGQVRGNGITSISYEIDNTTGHTNATLTYDDGATGQFSVQRGAPGKDGTTPTIKISSDGYWVINGVKQRVRAVGRDGDTRTKYVSMRNTKCEGKGDVYEYVFIDDDDEPMVYEKPPTVFIQPVCNNEEKSLFYNVAIIMREATYNINGQLVTRYPGFDFRVYGKDTLGSSDTLADIDSFNILIHDNDD